ncbi:MAG: transglycosylase domain-containing protein [Clostridia bacterium]|nr:transglycosylase domain-containing protein [Clostridia bacterium]
MKGSFLMEDNKFDINNAENTQEFVVPADEEAPSPAPESVAEAEDIEPSELAVIEEAEAKPRRRKTAEKEEGSGRLFRRRKTARPFLLSFLFDTLKLMAVLIVLAGFGVFGLVMGVAKAYVDTTPSLDVSRLTRSERTSYIYDMNGDLITTFAGMEYRDWVDISDIPDMLKNALISIEDVRFYKHGGVDFKRLFSAIVNTFRNENTHGGSTLTQQLIKNKILSNEKSYKRKIQEAYLSYELENVLSKDKILEAYMNDVFLGESNYGFAAAAKDYFGKTLNELTIRECAMLAGMVQKPYYTNPRANTYTRFYEDGTNKMDVTDKRTDVVLAAMYKAGCITSEQYKSALEEKVRIVEKSERTKLYDMPYFVEYGVYDVITHLLEQRGLDDTKNNRTAIENELRSGGYHIYLTVDPAIQNLVQETITNWAEYPGLQNPSASVQITTNADGTTMEVLQPQASAVIIDQATGQLRAVIGGRQEPTLKKQLNRAYQSSMPVGSAIKPLSVYGPALDLGLSCNTPILNAEVPIDGYGGAKGYPALGSTRWMGMIPIRRGIERSLNIVAARTLFEYVTPQVGAEYLIKLGVNPSKINVDGPGLALGTTGITPIQMAAAYATIANGGVYNQPISFTVVLDRDMNVVLDAKDCQKSYRVFEETSAYMLIDMLKDVVKNGTGKSAQIDGMTVAGKTGTNDDYTSVYFAGFTGYYTCSLWIGHDLYSEKLASGSTGGNSAAPLWQAFMSKIHEGKPDKPIMDVSPVEIGLAQVTICSVSGKLATEACMHDIYNPPITDWVAVDNMPSEYCTMHCLVEGCSASDELAGPYCPSSCRYNKCVLLVHPDSVFARLKTVIQYDENGEPVMLNENEYDYLDYFKTIFPNGVITELDPEHYHSYCLRHGKVCHVHGSGGGGGGSTSLEALVSKAYELIAEVNSYLAEVQTLPDTDRANLISLVNALQAALPTENYDTIKTCMDQLKTNYTYLSGLYPVPIATETDQPGGKETPEPSEPPSPTETPAPTDPPGGD